MTVEGIDVSHWQGTTPSLTGLSFLAARATFGTVLDDMYATHVANAREAGLVVLAYHFGDPNKTFAAQLVAFLAATKGVRLCVLDIEAGNMGLADAKLFIAGGRAAGKVMGVYHSLSGYPWALGQDFDWLAAWGSVAPPGPWEFWQYRGSPLDLDRFNGTRAELDTFFGGTYYAPDTSTGADMTIPVSMSGPFDINLTVGDQLYDQNFQPAAKCTKAQTVRGYFTTGTGFYAVSAIITADQKPQMLFVKIADVTGAPIPGPAADCSADVAAAVAPLNAKIAGIKDKTAAFAADVAND